MPKVSVIIPAYNAEAFIVQCLQSVLGQILADLEVFVVDDGSTDATYDLACSLASEDARLRILRQGNRYAGAARNAGMAHAAGDYIYFLDADDFIEPGALACMVARAEESAADIVACRAKSLDVVTGDEQCLEYIMKDLPKNELLSSGELDACLFQQFVGWPWDKLFRRSFVEARGLRFQDLRTTNDAFFVFMALALSGRTLCIEDVLVTHRVNNVCSLEGTRSKSWENALCAVCAIRDGLMARGLYERYSQSFENWVANFIRWNIATLDSALAWSLFERAKGLLCSLPKERGYYVDERDWRFVQLASMTGEELLSAAVFGIDEVVRQGESREYAERRADELQARLEEAEARLEGAEARLEDVYRSRSYRLGHALIAPIARLRRAWRR